MLCKYRCIPIKQNKMNEFTQDMHSKHQSASANDRTATNKTVIPVISNPTCRKQPSIIAPGPAEGILLSQLREAAYLQFGQLVLYVDGQHLFVGYCLP